MLSGRQIRPENVSRRTPVRVQLEHFHWVAQIEVEHFVGIQNVHLGKRTRLQQIVDCGANGAGSAGQLERARRGVSTAKMSALNRVRLQVQQLLDFVGSHRP